MTYSDGPQQRPVVRGREARQGITGHNVRYVLGFGLAIAVAVLAIVWYLYFP